LSDVKQREVHNETSPSKFLHLAASAAALPVVSRFAWAQAYPARPVRIIVPFTPAGSTDIVARLMGQWLSERLGQQFVIENRPGGGGNIGTEAVVRASADGYTLLMVGGWNAINATLYDKLSFNFIRDIAPVAGINREPYVIAVHPSVPAKSVPEFIAYAKANPGKVSMASAGIGTPGHVSGELFKMMAGVNMVHVPYRGAAPALADLLAGQVQVAFSTIGAVIEHIRAGKLRALAVTTATRSEALPDLPTVGEFVPGYEVSNWFGVGAPKATPAEIVEKLNKEINAGLADPKMKARLADFGGTPLVVSPADFAKLIAEETEKWGKVIRAANIKAE
jgi:tripartite-type tricarboxylate transporter receptor subunit TctC